MSELKLEWEAVSWTDEAMDYPDESMLTDENGTVFIAYWPPGTKDLLTLAKDEDGQWIGYLDNEDTVPFSHVICTGPREYVEHVLEQYANNQLALLASKYKLN
ncbi:MAG: hypothetical protein A2W31_11530 [Planctomycetes bacterium RBG_16_64_10]|nr:MAG: hypothetical protein A2W31_11530 [Planctomycetes bacterium RBG_16_64_10]